MLRCPCGNGDPFALPARLARLLAAAPPPDRLRWCPLDVIQQRILTLRCPHCDAAFLDFDGCAAVTCRCGGHFCAICLSPSGSSESIHAHVLACAGGSYYVTQHRWAAMQHDRRARLTRQYLRNVATEAGPVYAAAIFCELVVQHDGAPLPRRVRSLLRFSPLFATLLCCVGLRLLLHPGVVAAAYCTACTYQYAARCLIIP